MMSTDNCGGVLDDEKANKARLTLYICLDVKCLLMNTQQEYPVTLVPIFLRVPVKFKST